MAKSNGSPWKTISLQPLIGLLDVRSRPADIPIGSFRWIQSMQTTPEGKRCRRAGFSKAFSDLSIEGKYINWDLHHQSEIRSPTKMLFESTSSADVRTLFAGNQTSLFKLNEGTGKWTTLATTVTAPRWHAAELKDYVLFTNNVTPVLAHALGSNTADTIADLPDLRAKVILQYAGFILLMNITEGDGTKRPTRIKWCDLNLPLSWSIGGLGSIAGVQDLPFGDDILAASPMLGSVYIYTRRGIWRMTVTDPNNPITFEFVQVYSEPKNQTGCLTYWNTLVSTGTEHYYLSRDGAYRYSPYEPQPVRDDWLHRATGVIYTKPDTLFDGADCDAPVAAYVPAKRELWFSWPSIGHQTNNWTLVAQTEQKTADVLDTGFMCLTNYRRTPLANLCNEAQQLLGTSSVDWAIKDIGVVFYREYAQLDSTDLTDDLPLDGQTYAITGYNSILRGLIPLGLYDREKTVRSVLLDADVSEQDRPCLVKLRVGTSYGLQDPNDTDDICSVRWLVAGNKPLACADGMRVSEMISKNLRPAKGTEWKLYQRARFLYFEMTVINSDTGLAIGGDACFSRIDFDAMAHPKF